MSADSPSWQLWIDTGGTFTDCIAQSPVGDTLRLKILSSSILRGTITSLKGKNAVELKINLPVTRDIFKSFEFRIPGKQFRCLIDRANIRDNQFFLDKNLPSGIIGESIEISSNEEVPVLAARLLTATGLFEKFPPLQMKLGSTRGTNAILERKGAHTALLITKGFKDLLLIGNQQRPDLFTTNVIKSLPLYNHVIEVDERIESTGQVVRKLSKSVVDKLIAELKRLKIESVAVALLNSYKNQQHETELSDELQKSGFRYISVSSLLSSQIKILPRAETTVANAYLDPIIHNYISGIKKGLSGSTLSIMTSAGSLVRSDSFYPKDSLLSGPAGGVVGAANQAKQSGISKIIAFDMGGTSTDVSLYNERFNYQFESSVGNLKILSPSLAIETIAAGGGSICSFDGHRFTVGPHSAGASPGPACYGGGGPLTITDVNLLLGRLDPSTFTIPVYPAKSKEALDHLIKDIARTTGKKYREVLVLESFIQIANEKMSDAIRKISIQEGHDPRRFTLLSFGGAGGQHACALASILNMKNVFIPYDAGLLSAFGIGNASIERFEEQIILKNWSAFAPTLSPTLDALFLKAKQKLIDEGYADSEVLHSKTLLFARFAGQDTSIEIDFKEGDDVESVFRKKYISLYGHWTERSLEIESIRVVAVVSVTHKKNTQKKSKAYQPIPLSTQIIYTAGSKKLGKVYRWESLTSGATIKGPSLVVSGNSTVFVDENWQWTLDEFSNAHLTSLKKEKRNAALFQEADLELFTNRFTALAQEMGALLQRTSFSVNVKERLDFSCAVLDAKGYLVVNAPHIPVHLGSMGVCVREVCKVIAMNEGDVVITNHPAFGGSHLPDVTIIKPVFFQKKLIGYVANRAHHSEIGGRKPGSMPADATTLEEEGVIISPTYLIKKGKPQWEHIRQILTQGKYPTRSIDENLADLNAALASVNLGEKGLKILCASYGQRTIIHHMKSLRNHAAAILNVRLKTLRRKNYSASEKLDDGSLLTVAIDKTINGLRIDFSGSSSVNPGNLNATTAIVQSVVLYCLRLLINQPIPMNEGLMKHVKLILPNGLLNPDFSSGKLPAVVGGNTEVSQRLTDTLLKAFRLAACSQGTMNNFLFGNDEFGYYETICGGTGAGNGFNGADAVHQHMTNTRITDPEILEFRYPVRLERFDIRKNSGGKGKWKGGNGVEREILFKKNLEVNLLTQHRKEKPYGLNGGSPGRNGEQFLTGTDGSRYKLKGMDSISVKAGEKLLIKTPGGGGYGK